MPSCSPCSHFVFSLSFSLSSFPPPILVRVWWWWGARKDTRRKLGGREILRAHWQLCLCVLVSNSVDGCQLTYNTMKTDQTHRFRRPGGKRHNTQCPINSLQGSEKFLSPVWVLESQTLPLPKKAVYRYRYLYYMQAISYDTVPASGKASYSSRLGFGNIRSHNVMNR